MSKNDDYNNYGNHYGTPPEDSGTGSEEQFSIEPVYQQMLGHLAKAHKLATEYSTHHNLGAHVPTVKRIQGLVTEAAGHSASFLQGRAAHALNQALNETLSISKDYYKNPIAYLKESKDPKDPWNRFHKHIGLFVEKAEKESGKE
jgi:hypothetical protein